jgi:hypothetical protein
MRIEPYIEENINGVVLSWTMDISDDVEVRINREYSGRSDDYYYKWSLHATSSKAGGGGFAIPANIPTTESASVAEALLEVKEYFSCKAKYYTTEREQGLLDIMKRFPI